MRWVAVWDLATERLAVLRAGPRWPGGFGLMGWLAGLVWGIGRMGDFLSVGMVVAAYYAEQAVVEESLFRLPG